MNWGTAWNMFWTAAGPVIAFIACFASIFQSKEAIRIANKQIVFEKQCFLYKKLSKLYEKCKGEDEIILSMDGEGILLANKALMMQYVLSEDWGNIKKGFEENPSYNDQTEVKAFIRNFEGYSIEAKMVFSGDVADYIGKFFYDYYILLDSIHECKIRMDNIEKLTKPEDKKRSDMLDAEITISLENKVKEYIKNVTEDAKKYEVIKNIIEADVIGQKTDVKQRKKLLQKVVFWK